MSNSTLVIDLLGTLFFSISGTLLALKQGKFDVYGVILVALLTAVGGGTVRDILLVAHPIAWISQQEFLIMIVVGVVSALLIWRWFKKLGDLLILVDSAAVAFAALAGVQKSLAFDASPLTALFLGVVTATFGGIIRDVICNEIPKVLYSEIYASIILLGTSVFLGIDHFFPNSGILASLTAYILIVSVRYVSVKRRWGLPPLTEELALKKKRKRNRLKTERRNLIYRFKR